MSIVPRRKSPAPKLKSVSYYKKKLEITCKGCGILFFGERPTRKFCDHNCTRNFWATGKTKQERDAEKAKLHPLLVTKGTKPRKGKVFKCGNCGADVYKLPCKVGSFKINYCSRVCQIEYLKKNAFRLNCIICDKVFFCQPCQVGYRNRKTCSQICRSALQTKRAEEKRLTQPITRHALDRRIRYSKKMDNWRRAIFARDDYTCQFCKKRGGYIEADHIKPFAFFPDLRFELSNGRTLCRPCHDKTKMSAKKMREVYANAS